MGLSRAWKKVKKWATNPVSFVEDTLGYGVDAISEAVGEITGANDLADQQQQMLNEQQRSNQELENLLREEQDRTRTELETAEANAARRRRNRDETAGRSGRSSTILTSPLGIVDDPGSRRPTLLGA